MSRKTSSSTSRARTTPAISSRVPLIRGSPPARACSRMDKRLAALFQRAQPRREISDCQQREDEAAGEPHDQPGKLLVLKRSESPCSRAPGIVGVPRVLAERHQRGQHLALQPGGEQVDDRAGIMEMLLAGRAE